MVTSSTACIPESPVRARRRSWGSTAMRVACLPCPYRTPGMRPDPRRRRAARLPEVSRGCTTRLTLSIGRLLEKLVLAGEQLAHRLVFEHVLDGAGKGVGHGEYFDLA